MKAVQLDVVAAVEGDLFGVGDQTGVNVSKVALPIGFLSNLGSISPTLYAQLLHVQIPKAQKD
jgi:hypothetical protein